MHTATRTRRIWKPDLRGYYTRQLGWKLSGTGKRQQHKFILGTDRREAERRDRKLQELREAFVEGLPEPRPLWSSSVLEVAMDLMQPRLIQRIVDQGIARLDMGARPGRKQAGVKRDA